MMVMGPIEELAAGAQGEPGISDLPDRDVPGTKRASSTDAKPSCAYAEGRRRVCCRMSQEGADGSGACNGQAEGLREATGGNQTQCLRSLRRRTGIRCFAKPRSFAWRRSPFGSG